MALARPVVPVYSAVHESREVGSVSLPPVMQSVVRPDLVNFVHYNMNRNHRQAYGVKPNAGYQTAAESWGTGRAVARIPRVPGGGTHRAGQAAFGNMCRAGGMFAPLKTWRRWHRKINLTQRRQALCSAIAGSSYTGLVMGRGHRIETIPQLPLVVSDDVQRFTKTRQAISMLKNLGCEEELRRVKESRKIRAGKGKARNRRYVMRRGPLVVYAANEGLTKAFANIPGVDTCCVERLNLLQLAPGGTMGRLVVWTKTAFQRLTGLYGEFEWGTSEKSGFVLERPIMTNPDYNRLVRSPEIQAVVRRPMLPGLICRRVVNRNPYRSYKLMKQLLGDPRGAKRTEAERAELRKVKRDYQKGMRRITMASVQQAQGAKSTSVAPAAAED